MLFVYIFLMGLTIIFAMTAQSAMDKRTALKDAKRPYSEYKQDENLALTMLTLVFVAAIATTITAYYL